MNIGGSINHHHSVHTGTRTLYKFHFCHLVSNLTTHPTVRLICRHPALILYFSLAKPSKRLGLDCTAFTIQVRVIVGTMMMQECTFRGAESPEWAEPLAPSSWQTWHCGKHRFRHWPSDLVQRSSHYVNLCECMLLVKSRQASGPVWCAMREAWRALTNWAPSPIISQSCIYVLTCISK